MLICCSSHKQQSNCVQRLTQSEKPGLVFFVLNSCKVTSKPMTHKILGSLTATVLTTTLGVAVVSTVAVAQTQVSDANGSTESETANTSSASTQTVAASSVSNSITRIFPHLSGSSTAATLYVRNIPLVTFLGEEKQENNPSIHNFFTHQAIRQGEVPNVNQSEKDPVWRAAITAEQIEQLSIQDAAKITAAWDSDRKTYIIKAGDRELLTIDQKNILPDSTKDIDEDALQATNRLRRLVGGASPLKMSDIRSRPQAVQMAYATPAGVAATGNVIRQYRGMASWYGPGFHGRRTANGERFNQNAMTAAHRSLPFGTQVRVTNNNNGRSVVVRINDRGPFIRGRIIDLSRSAASNIGMLGSGVAPVTVEVLGN